jgi:hypothetical protein
VYQTAGYRKWDILFEAARRKFWLGFTSDHTTFDVVTNSIVIQGFLPQYRQRLCWTVTETYSRQSRVTYHKAGGNRFACPQAVCRDRLYRSLKSRAVWTKVQPSVFLKKVWAWDCQVLCLQYLCDLCSAACFKWSNWSLLRRVTNWGGQLILLPSPAEVREKLFLPVLLPVFLSPPILPALLPKVSVLL